MSKEERKQTTNTMACNGILLLPSSPKTSLIVFLEPKLKDELYSEISDKISDDDLVVPPKKEFEKGLNNPPKMAHDCPKAKRKDAGKDRPLGFRRQRAAEWTNARPSTRC